MMASFGAFEFKSDQKTSDQIDQVISIATQAVNLWNQTLLIAKEKKGKPSPSRKLTHGVAVVPENDSETYWIRKIQEMDIATEEVRRLAMDAQSRRATQTEQ